MFFAGHEGEEFFAQGVALGGEALDGLVGDCCMRYQIDGFLRGSDPSNGDGGLK